MKKFPLYHAVCFGLAFISLILPCKSYDIYAPNNGSGPAVLLEEGVLQSGFSFFPSYIPPLIIFAISLMVLIGRNMVTGIIGLVLGLSLLLYLRTLYIVLHIEPDESISNSELEYGYFLITAVCVIYFVFLIRNLVLVDRHLKERSKLLDEF